MVGAIVAVTIALTGLGYVYRMMDGPQVSQQRDAAGSDRGESVLSETSVAAPSNQGQAVAPSDPGDKVPETVSSAGEWAEAMPAPREPVEHSQRDGNLLRRLEGQVRARATAFLAPPRDIPTSAQAVYSVTLTSSGRIEELILTKSSGHAGFDESVREALLAAQPYPRVGELLGYGASRTAIVAMKAERPPQPTRKTQRGAPRTAPAFSKQRLVEMPSAIDSSEEASQEPSQPVASSPISPSGVTSLRNIEECAPGFAGTICRERKRWERCNGRWGTQGCEVYQGATATD